MQVVLSLNNTKVKEVVGIPFQICSLCLSEKAYTKYVLLEPTVLVCDYAPYYNKVSFIQSFICFFIHCGYFPNILQLTKEFPIPRLLSYRAIDLLFNLVTSIFNLLRFSITDHAFLYLRSSVVLRISVINHYVSV